MKFCNGTTGLFLALLITTGCTGGVHMLHLEVNQQDNLCRFKIQKGGVVAMNLQMAYSNDLKIQSSESYQYLGREDTEYVKSAYRYSRITGPLVKLYFRINANCEIDVNYTNDDKKKKWLHIGFEVIDP